MGNSLRHLVPSPVYGDETKSRYFSCWRHVMSRAVIYETFGGPEVLQLREVAEPHAGPGEVRVRVAAAGLNPMDWLIPARPEAAAQFGLSLPSGFGYDFAGVVDEAGEGAAGFAVGDRVYGGAMARAAADFVVVTAVAEGAEG